MNDIQKKGYNILIKIMGNGNSELIKDPTLEKRYIKNGDILITLEKSNLNITNGVYYYDIYLSDKMYDYIVSKFNNRLFRKINKYETEINEKVKSNLTNILEDFDNR